jgi:hypothetical protein
VGILQVELPRRFLRLGPCVQDDLDSLGRIQLEGGEVIVGFEAGRIPLDFFAYGRRDALDGLAKLINIRLEGGAPAAA